jgi:hypothetical protein
MIIRNKTGLRKISNINNELKNENNNKEII